MAGFATLWRQTTMTSTPPTDAELINRGIEGDRTSLSELHRRHRAAVERLANSYQRLHGMQDLVDAAFEHALDAVRHGGSPEDSFRIHVYVALRGLATDDGRRGSDGEIPESLQAELHEPAMAPAERELVVQAYESLPARWQTVLWHTAVEVGEPGDLAPILGRSTKAAVALAHRASEKLRQAYLLTHLRTTPAGPCIPHRSQLGAFVRGGLDRRDRTEVERHLDLCGVCQDLVSELSAIDRVLRHALLPYFLAATVRMEAVRGAASPAPLALVKQGCSKVRAHPRPILLAGLAITLLTGLVASAQSNGESPRSDTAVGPVEEADDPASSLNDLPNPASQSGDEAETPDHTDDAGPSGEEAAEPSRTAERTTPGPTESPPTTEPPSTRTPTTTGTAPSRTGTSDSRPPATSPPTTTSTSTNPPSSSPSAPAPRSQVIWDAGSSTLEITVTNTGSTSTDHMLVTVALSGGALTSARPSGCNLAAALVVLSECGLTPIAPGQTRVVRQPIAPGRFNPSATVSQCTVGLLALRCGGPVLSTQSVRLQ